MAFVTGPDDQETGMKSHHSCCSVCDLMCEHADNG